MQKLILIRHGETDVNKRKVLHGYFDEECLTTLGRSQIEKVAQFLKKYSPLIIYSSTEIRAYESATIIAHKLKIKVKKVKGLHERNWGKFSGKSWEEIKKVLDPMTLQERYKYVPPEGECWQEFETRLINAVIGLLNKGNKIVVVVTHGGAIRALMPFLLAKTREESFKYDPKNASITMFEIVDLRKHHFKEMLL